MFTAMFEFLGLVHDAFYHYKADYRFVGTDTMYLCVMQYFGHDAWPEYHSLTEGDREELAAMFDTQLGKDIQYGIMEMLPLNK